MGQSLPFPSTVQFRSFSKEDSVVLSDDVEQSAHSIAIQMSSSYSKSKLVQLRLHDHMLTIPSRNKRPNEASPTNRSRHANHAGAHQGFSEILTCGQKWFLERF